MKTLFINLHWNSLNTVDQKSAGFVTPSYIQERDIL